MEVSISARLNKFSKKFGFARFTGMADARLLAVKLDNIIIDGKKIHANLPIFDRGRDLVVPYGEWEGNTVLRSFRRALLVRLPPNQVKEERACLLQGQ